MKLTTHEYMYLYDALNTKYVYKKYLDQRESYQKLINLGLLRHSEDCQHQMVDITTTDKGRLILEEFKRDNDNFDLLLTNHLIKTLKNDLANLNKKILSKRKCIADYKQELSELEKDFYDNDKKLSDLKTKQEKLIKEKEIDKSRGIISRVRLYKERTPKQ